MRPVYRTYTRRMLLAMLAYVVVLFTAIFALRWVESTALRGLIILTPILPIGFAARAMLRLLRDSDELERRIALEALALAALLLTLGTFALGLLARAGVLVVDGTVALIWILPTYMLLYGACAHLAKRRYR